MQTIIEKIHSEFNTASDKLLAQAKSIISGNEHLIDKAAKLKQVGFVNTAEVKRADELSMSVETANLIEHYQLHYPNNKFITEEMVKAICDKYNLVCAPTERYTGFVPKNQLDKISKFQLNDGDAAEDLVKIRGAWNFAFIDFFCYPLGALFIRLSTKQSYFSIKDDRFYWMGERLWSMALHTTVYITNWKVIDKTSLLICAPKKDIITKGLTRIGSVLSVSKSFTKADFPDPVVLHPCKGGYLILAAWGDEASDPIVVNEKHN